MFSENVKNMWSKYRDLLDKFYRRIGFKPYPAVKNKKNRVIFTFIFTLFLLFLTLDFFFPFSTKIEHSPIVTDSNSRILHAFLTSDDKWRMKTELAEITPELQTAILHKEDKYFYYHFGINPLAIARAAFNNIVRGKRTSGASTITMQVARLLQPKPRTYGNKLLEMWQAIQLEWHCSKKEILQLYLNLVPYGGNIEGVKSAAVLYFDKAPNHLSIAEITALAIIPNRPTSLGLGRNNGKIETARNQWLKRFQAARIFDHQAIEDALTEPLNAKTSRCTQNCSSLGSKDENQIPQSSHHPHHPPIQPTAKGRKISAGLYSAHLLPTDYQCCSNGFKQPNQSSRSLHWFSRFLQF